MPRGPKPGDPRLMGAVHPMGISIPSPHRYLPTEVKKDIWNLVRPHKDYRLWLKDFPGLPSWVRPLLRGSVDLEAVAKWAAGPDLWSPAPNMTPLDVLPPEG